MESNVGCSPVEVVSKVGCWPESVVVEAAIVDFVVSPLEFVVVGVSGKAVWVVEASVVVEFQDSSFMTISPRQHSLN